MSSGYFGFKPSPSIKLSSNTDVYLRMTEDIDLDCGAIATGEAEVAEKGKRAGAGIVMPNPSFWPFLSALGMFLLGVGMLIDTTVLLSLGPVADKYWFADEAKVIADELQLPIYALAELYMTTGRYADAATQFEVPYLYTTPNGQTFKDSHEHGVERHVGLLPGGPDGSGRCSDRNRTRFGGLDRP